jgi:uncharacterized alkaline shock family protein YloU
VDRSHHVAASSELGRVVLTGDAIAQIVGHAVAESYGVVGRAGRRTPRQLFGKGRVTTGIGVKAKDDGVALDIHVVVEHGLNLAEVAATIRNRVAYEIERHTRLPVTALEVHIDDVRKSGE